VSGPDYPLLTVPGYELYQLAHLATFVVDALARHRRAVERGGRVARRAAAGDVHAGRLALSRAVHDPDLADGPLPRPLDLDTYRHTQQLVHDGRDRQIEIVSLTGLGRSSWAVVGQIPEIGPVGAEVPSHHLAAALREHLRTQPATELAGWAITPQPAHLGIDRWGTAVEAAAIAALTPDREQHRLVAEALRGLSPQIDTLIERHPQSCAPKLDEPTTTDQKARPGTAAPTSAAFNAAETALPAPETVPTRSATGAAPTAAPNQARSTPTTRPDPRPSHRPETR
jgi:hypothetical protein